MTARISGNEVRSRLSFRRTAAEPKIPADVGAHARRLTRGVELVDVVDRHAIRLGHLQYGCLDLAVRDRLVGVEQRVDPDRRDQEDPDQQGDAQYRAPKPPAFARAADNGVKQTDRQREQQRAHRQPDHLFAEPRPESLRGHAVVVLAHESLVDRQRQRQDKAGDRKQRAVDRVAEERLAADTLRPVAHPRGAPPAQQHDRNCKPEQKVPELQPVAAFEVRVRAGHNFRRQTVHVGLRSRVGVARQVRVPCVVHRPDMELRIRRRRNRAGGRDHQRDKDDRAQTLQYRHQCGSSLGYGCGRDCMLPTSLCRGRDLYSVVGM